MSAIGLAREEAGVYSIFEAVCAKLRIRGRTSNEEIARTRMSVDIAKQLEKAKRFVEKGRIDEAIEAYQSALTASPNHLDSIQSLGDLYTRQNRPDRAAVYYGMLFDRFTSPQEESKALALYTRFLKAHQQPPERAARYAALLQKQNRAPEAIEQFESAALAFEAGGKRENALSCFERIAVIDFENRDRHIAVGEMAERMGNSAAAARGYLRAGQLSTQNKGDALKFFAKAYELMPNDRSAALLYAEMLLKTADAASAAKVLGPLSEAESDVAFLDMYADALMRSGQLDAARAVIERTVNQGKDSTERIFALASEFIRAGQPDKAVDALAPTKKRLRAARRESEFSAAMDRLVDAFPKSLRLVQCWAAYYAEINRETKYFEALGRLFDLSLASDQVAAACEAFEQLVEIDPYDSGNQERFDQLKGRATDEFLSRVRGRLSNVATHRSAAPAQETGESKAGETPEPSREQVQSGQALEDMLVQAEIFVQYALQAKAIERLQHIAEQFPGEVESNERLRSLFEAVRWWPEARGNRSAPVERPQPAAQEPASGAAAGFTYGPETMRDLTKISEINQNVFRQPSPRAMLSAAVNEVGTYLRASRCVAAVGPPGQPPQMASQFCASGVAPLTAKQVVRLIDEMARSTPDTLGGLSLDAVGSPLLKELGLETSVGVRLIDPETQTSAGIMIVGYVAPRAAKPNETHFLQSVGDQMLMCVQHTRLRSLVRTLAVADEKTGLLARSSYIDCLLNESQRARTQGLPLTLALLQIDGGPELLRQRGEPSFERYMEQLGKAVHAIVRHSDLTIKYTSWALAVVLPDTALAGARVVAEKLISATGGLQLSGDEGQLTLSVAVAEAVARQEYDNEDIVTDLINRAETGIEEARKRGGNTIVTLELAKT